MGRGISSSVFGKNFRAVTTNLRCGGGLSPAEGNPGHSKIQGILNGSVCGDLQISTGNFFKAEEL